MFEKDCKFQDSEVAVEVSAAANVVCAIEDNEAFLYTPGSHVADAFSD